MRERQAQALKKDAELKANAITVPRARGRARTSTHAASLLFCACVERCA